MAVVSQNKIENVRYLFGSPSTVKSRYNQIKRTFPEGKEYLIFAEPVFVQDTNSIIWSTEHNGSIVNFSKLSPTDQVIAKKLLTKSIQVLLNAAKKYKTNELIEFIYNCIEIPSMNNVFLVRGDGDDKVVLTEWGFVSDVPGSEKGLLAKIINIKRVDMIFDVVFDDDEPAPNQKFFFEFEDQKQTHFSDADAKIKLVDVKVDDEVVAYQKDGETKLNEQSFVCYEKGKYTLKAIRMVDMPFKVLNAQDEPVPEQTFIFEYNGEQKKLTSDAEGKMTLEGIKEGKEVVAYQTKDDEKINEHKFVCEKEKEYILRLEDEEDPVYNMRFKVIDPNGEPVPNAKVKIKYEGKTEEKYTDNQGYTILENVEPQTQVQVVAIGKKQKKDKDKENQEQQKQKDEDLSKDEDKKEE